MSVGLGQVGLDDHESQIAPYAGMPRCSRPCTTRHVSCLFEMQMTASAPNADVRLVRHLDHVGLAVRRGVEDRRGRLHGQDLVDQPVAVRDAR